MLTESGGRGESGWSLFLVKVGYDGREGGSGMARADGLNWYRLLMVYAIGFCVHALLSMFAFCGVMAWAFCHEATHVNRETGNGLISWTVGLPTALIRERVEHLDGYTRLKLAVLMGIADSLVFALLYTLAYALFKLTFRRKSLAGSRR